MLTRPDAAPAASCVERYLRPSPRVRTGLLLGRNRAASSCVDLSDGLGDGVARLAESSGVGITIDAATVPVDPDARRWFELQGQDPVDRGNCRWRRLRTALHGPTAFARPPEGCTAARRRASHADRRLHRRRGARAGVARLAIIPQPCQRDSATSDDPVHARPGHALARRPAACERHTGANRRRLRARRVPWLLADPRAAHHRRHCARLHVQPEPRRGAAGRVFEPAMDHGWLLRVHDDDGCGDPAHDAARRPSGAPRRHVPALVAQRASSGTSSCGCSARCSGPSRWARPSAQPYWRPSPTASRSRSSFAVAATTRPTRDRPERRTAQH